jgi:hypothetical protein
VIAIEINELMMMSFDLDGVCFFTGMHNKDIDFTFSDWISEVCKKKENPEAPLGLSYRS